MSETSNARICVPVCEAHAGDLRQAIARAAQVADIVELRLDYLAGDELFKALRELPALARASPRPLMLTLRPAGPEGGQCWMDDRARLSFWTEQSLLDGPHTSFADLELVLALQLRQQEEEKGAACFNWERVICSHHDFSGVPDDLEKIYERMASTPARVLKIAVRANDITDCLPLFRLLERARRDGRQIVAIAMGTAGMMTRILGPSRGAFLTYASLDAVHANAPGQVRASDLRQLYRLDRLDRQTSIHGLVGLPVLHSVSPHMHNAAFEARGLNAVYLPLEVRDLDGFLRRMIHPRSRELSWNLRGLSITAPHKRGVMDHLDWVDQPALEIGAVNTIVVEDDALHGYNTDAAALLAPLEERVGPTSGKQVAVIGAGGAARSALWGLREAGAQAHLFARNTDAAAPLAAQFGVPCEQLEGTRFDQFEVVINATPLGTRGASENETPARTAQLRGARLAYDLVYNPLETRFLREARAAGCATLGGLHMLVAQAAAQFKLWTGEDAPSELMSEAARAALDK